MPMTYLRPDEIEAVRLQILAVYQAAFTPPPYCLNQTEVTRFSGTLLRHTRRPGYRCVVARETQDGPVVGFAYGYTSAPGQWWYDLIARTLDPQAASRWLADAFELVELAVTPAAQGRGSGGGLHDLLLAGLPHHSAVLSTIQEETAALHLYRKRGWVTLLSDFIFPGGTKRFLIMGLELRDLKNKGQAMIEDQ